MNLSPLPWALFHTEKVSPIFYLAALYLSLDDFINEIHSDPLQKLAFAKFDRKFSFPDIEKMSKLGSVLLLFKVKVLNLQEIFHTDWNFLIYHRAHEFWMFIVFLPRNLCLESSSKYKIRTTSFSHKFNSSIELCIYWHETLRNHLYYTELGFS